jgi:DNA topoisomerase II
MSINNNDVEIYKYMEDKEHILEHVGMYAGANHKIDDIQRWILVNNKIKSNKIYFELKNIKFTPALEKIYDEIIVNARDQYIRHPNLVTKIEINYNSKNGEISVYNNGPGINIYLNKQFNIYSPELIFTKMRTSENYEKTNKITGGKHGYGAKLTAVFSKKFTIETIDSINKIKYTQTYENNLSIINPPIIINNYNDKPYTKITFIPDYERFEMKGLEKDTQKLFEKRVYDLVACTDKKINISLNGQKLPINTFSQYIDLYLSDDNKSSKVIEKISNRWEICVANTDYDKFMHISFVNGINTYNGGTHVTYIINQITKKIKEKLINKNKKFETVTPTMIKNNIFLFINCIIEDPEFPSQTKESLQTQSKRFGSECIINEKFIKKIMEKTNITKKISELLLAKENLSLEKNSGSKRSNINIPKLEDATWAGTSKSSQCVLFLTEGDSAKTFAMSGLSVVKREKYGVYPLKGKVMNVRAASNSQVSNNKELTNLTKILGLQHGKIYKSISELRYGHIMILTDADIDGSHIKGLIINFIHYYWPELTKIDEFIQVFITPILKARKGNGKKMIVKEFYSDSKYQEWKNSLTENELNKWTIKYYKGLGTSVRTEAISYFKRIDNLVKSFEWKDDNDNKFIQLAFDKHKTNERKEWIKKYDPNFIIDNSKTLITYQDFINKELIHFSTNDNIRSIPSIMDGLKPGQRKILYTIFTKKITNDIKVAQLSGAVSALTLYHHGEDSLNGTIVNLAQNFIGSNNIELLYPSGAFGSRRTGGNDSASPRYIHTYIGELTPYIFNDKDFNILNYLNEDGKQIEPIWYVPIIPMILCNGTNGIGTGYSTKIPNYNPIDVIKNIKNKLHNKNMISMIPWYRGFKGIILQDKNDKNKYIIKGVYNIIKRGIIQITELPIGLWTDTYKKKYLEPLKEKGIINKYISNCDDVNIDYTIYLDNSIYHKFAKSKLDYNGIDGFERELHLISTITITNMHLFDSNNMIKKYHSPLEIIDDYYNIRLDYYDKRRNYLLNIYNNDLTILKSKIKFIKCIIKKQIVIQKRNKSDIILDIKKYDIKPHPNENNDNTFEGYSFLLNMKLYDLTKEKIKELMEQYNKIKNALDELEKKTNKDLWLLDLDKLEKQYPIYIKNWNKNYFDSN